MAARLGAKGLSRKLGKKTALKELLVGDGCLYKTATGSKMVSESDPAFEEKAILAMTVLRASYQGSEVLDEKEISERFGAKAPAGFYLMGPDGKVAAGFFAARSGEGKPSLEAEEWGKGLARAGLLADPCWTSRVEYDIDRFCAAADPFADWLLAESEEKADGLARQGFLAVSRVSGWSDEHGKPEDIVGYPAPLALPGAWKIEPEDLEDLEDERPGSVPQMSMLASIGDMLRLPFFNHNASSAINNTRDIRTVGNRKPDRAKIIETIAQEWFERQRLISGDFDGALSFVKGEVEGSAGRAARRGKVARKRFDEGLLGKPRVAYFAPKSTTMVGSGASRMILSADMALVDGQHSARDYWLIAEGLAGRTPEYREKLIEDCSPKEIRKAFEAKIRGLIKDSGMSKAEAKERGLLGEEAFGGFCEYGLKKRSKVEITPVVTAELARLKTIVENDVRQQVKEDKALAACHADVLEFVAAFNRGAEAAGDDRRMTGVKSAHAEMGVSARDSSRNIELKKIFRALSALALPHGSLDMREEATKADLANAPAWADRDVALIFPHLRGEARQGAKERFVAIYESLGKLKSRDFDMTEDRLQKTLDAIAGRESPEAAAKARTGLKRFSAVVGSMLESRFGFKAKGASEKDRRAYAMGIAALEISEELDLSWAPPKNPSAEDLRKAEGNQRLEKALSSSTLESVMLRMAADQFREGAESLALGGEAILARIRAAMERMRERALGGQEDGTPPEEDFAQKASGPGKKPWVPEKGITQINKVRDNVSTAKKGDELGLGGYIAEERARAGTLFDMIPMEGPSYEELKRENDRLGREAKAGSGARAPRAGRRP